MIKLSKLTDYAVVLLDQFSNDSGLLLNTAKLSEESHVPEPTVAKILKLLRAADIVSSVKGVNGGYRLNKSKNDISVLSIIEAIEGPIKIVDCADSVSSSCSIQSNCSLTGRWQPVNDSIKKCLSAISVAGLTSGSKSIKSDLTSATIRVIDTA